MKKDIALRIITIQDGARLDGFPDDFAIVGTNKDVFNECYQSMKQAKPLADELAKIEE